MFDFEAEVDRSISLLQKKAQSVPVRSGTVVRLVGLRMEARGLMAPIGACCAVEGTSGHRIEAEVVGFSDKTLYLMPFSEPVGIGPGASNFGNVFPTVYDIVGRRYTLVATAKF